MKTFLFSLSLALAALACSKAKEPAPGGAAPAPAAAAANDDGAKHAAADVKPGSHDDWCDEHGVPESQCTRCNPDLIPAFKATGDWCEEHGMPESQCRVCNPDLRIERPARATSR